jgi:hypothetical protein
VKSQIPFDFDLVSHINERTCAEQHLRLLEKGDVVIYDRGYYSYLLLHRHFISNVHAVFRLQKNNSAAIDAFASSLETDIIVSISPAASTRKEIQAEYPKLDIVPIPLRLIKYQIDGEAVCLGTTLLDQAMYPKEGFIELYHSRWGIEELYKVSKRVFIIEDFHAKTERGVKQEIFAHFALVTMSRIFANQADGDLNLTESSAHHADSALLLRQSSSGPKSLFRFRTNFRNCIHIFTSSIEELLCLHVKMKAAIKRAFLFVRKRHQRERPGRSYQRKSMRPETKWHARTKRDKKSPKPLRPLHPVDLPVVP